MEAITVTHTHTLRVTQLVFRINNSMKMCVCLRPVECVSLFQLDCTRLSHVINTICFPVLLTNQQSCGRAVGSRTHRKEGDGALLVFYTRQKSRLKNEEEEK